MSPTAVIFRSLRHHWRINFAVALGVAATTAVLTGALLVGDSMRGSLRDLTLDRLALVDHILVANRFFREELAAEAAKANGFDQNFTAALPAILLQTTIEDPDSDRRAAQVTTLGVGDDFFKQLDPSREYPQLAYDTIVLNEPLAAELGMKEPGGEVLLRIARPSQIPADSPLGEKTEELAGRRLKVSHIIPADGLGRFSLQSSQQTPLVAYVAKRTLQARSVLDQKGKVNAIVLAGRERARPAPPAATNAVAEALRPTLEDFGLKVELVMIGAAEKPVVRYINLSSDQMLLPPVVAQAALAEFKSDGAQPAMTYLANWIRTADGQAKIPYSTVTAIDSTKQLGPLFRENGSPLVLPEDQIVLNSWAVDDMAAQGRNITSGDKIELVFFEPESTHGDPQERTAKFFLGTTAPLAKKNETPTIITDDHFTPEVPGLTDKESIDNWDPPFPYDASRVRSTPPNNQDDQFWRDHKGTPKAFISFAAGEKLWKSRFGSMTTIRIPASDTVTVESVSKRLSEKLDPADLGFVFRPVKRQALAASAGTTAFEGLFIGFSFFIIAAAVMLVAILFQLGIEQRASQIGVMLAVGLDQKSVARMLSREGLIVAAIGGLAGVGLGIGYAWLMIAALNNPAWWGRAISVSFLKLHLDNALSLVIGFLAGVIISWLTIIFTVRRLRKLPVRDLVAGRASDIGQLGQKRRRLPIAEMVAGLLLLSAIGLFALATQLAGEAQAMSFFGGGAAILAAALTFIWARLRHASPRAAITGGSWPLLRLAMRSAARNPWRSTLTIGLVASATFLIVAISAFRIEPDQQGAGGFDIIAQSTRPLLYDLNSREGRRSLAIAGDNEKLLTESQFALLRVKGGDDASCLNLYQPQQPQVLGVTQQMLDLLAANPQFQFNWAETAAVTPEEKKNPWLLLDKKFEDTPDAVPVILDKNTAMYSMHLFAGKGTGVVFEIVDEDGRKQKFRIVGLLANSIFQGSLLISEANFKRLYPDISGYRLLLARGPKGTPPENVVAALENSLSEQGVDAALCEARLHDLLAVQNTYLSTFQSLGALGLLLGTFGLATVQLRSVLERRGELALMRSTGFARRRLAQMVMLENVVLLVGGLLTGLVCALLAVLPHWLIGGAQVPLAELAIYLGIVLVVGVVSGLAAVLATLRAPLVGALRGN